MEDEYQSARENPALRPALVRRVDLGEYSRFISQVSYAVRDITDDARMICEIPLRAHIGIPGGRSRIKVFPIAFERYGRFAEFATALIYHEGHHAREAYENPTLLIGDAHNHVRFLLGMMTPSERIVHLERVVRTREMRAYANSVAHALPGVAAETLAKWRLLANAQIGCSD